MEIPIITKKKNNDGSNGHSLDIDEQVVILEPHTAAHEYDDIGTIKDIKEADKVYGIEVEGQEEEGIYRWYTGDEIERL